MHDCEIECVTVIVLSQLSCVYNEIASKSKSECISQLYRCYRCWEGAISVMPAAVILYALRFLKKNLNRNFTTTSQFAWYAFLTLFSFITHSRNKKKHWTQSWNVGWWCWLKNYRTVYQPTHTYTHTQRPTHIHTHSNLTHSFPCSCN